MSQHSNINKLSPRGCPSDLLTQERLFKAIFNDPFWAMGLLYPNGIVLEINQTALDFEGLTEEDRINCPFWQAQGWSKAQEEYLDTDHLSPTQHYLKAAIASSAKGEIVQCQVEVRKKDHQITTVELTFKPVVNEQGEVILLIFQGRDMTTENNLEAKLLESEERWQLILQGTGDGIFDWNIITGEVYQSPWLKEMLGYQEQDMANTYEKWKNLVHPDDIEGVLAQIQAHLTQKTSRYLAEYRMRCADGTYKWILARGQAKWDEKGQPIRMVGFNQDISRQKEAEAEIQRLNQELEERVQHRTAQLEAANRQKDEFLRSERQAKAQIQLYQDIVENIQIGLIVWRLDDPNDKGSFRLIAANPAANDLIGTSLKECFDHRLDQCLPNAFISHPIILEAHAEVIRTQQAQAIPKFTYTHPQGGTKILTLKLFPLPDNCVGVAFEDITQRKQTEKALVGSTRRYRLVVNSVKEIIFQTDLNGCWTFLNPAWTEITGYTIIESLNHHFTDFIFAPDDRQQCDQMFQELIEGKREVFQTEFRCQTKDENFRWLEMTAQLSQDEEAENNYTILGTINDVTERKRTEAILQARANELIRLNTVLLTTTAQLEKRNHELDQFAYVASHDLKAPLRAIANLSVWLEEDLRDKLDEDTRYQMELLRGRVHRMEALINGLLQYSRVGRLKGQAEVINVEQLLKEVIDSLAPPPEFKIDIKGQMPTLVTQPFPLRQVFANLLGNALKHHHNHRGHIEISAQEHEQFYQFSVRDDGPGIDPLYHDKIFNIFQTLEARDKTENTGIGLSIVKKTVETQKGTIWVESQLGQGTTFHFTWPKLTISNY
ncbi:PAS/PAC sensor signal transduction histidine kinase [Gloeothece citriformis PCC 7424]|uniref:histidine kinase n=1 Tax=Gloeothece citriformis (strain PCC 7424) TaxID=65393 RepID=B7K8A3_GLOC7|nr:PAS domain S-box protein [Gloeothece citriformis]ACK69863.1 PAS/PAC sensor signal transduction histidine kinase [Gloeothece citriformis PCC 7424]